MAAQTAAQIDRHQRRLPARFPLRLTPTQRPPRKHFARTCDRPTAHTCKKENSTPLARSPTAAELKDTLPFVQHQPPAYTADKQPTPRELALTHLCQLLMSLNEVVYVE